MIKVIRHLTWKNKWRTFFKLNVKESPYTKNQVWFFILKNGWRCCILHFEDMKDENEEIKYGWKCSQRTYMHLSKSLGEISVIYLMSKFGIWRGLCKLQRAMCQFQPQFRYDYLRKNYIRIKWTCSERVLKMYPMNWYFPIDFPILLNSTSTAAPPSADSLSFESLKQIHDMRPIMYFA